ncbi:hypothetical protein ZWY2020_013956 [Hordeum vulgare]|nr:hypothetical protein ZWY2020_013956 [Hordeum vulgare]
MLPATFPRTRPSTSRTSTRRSRKKRVQYAKTKSDCFAKADGSYAPKEKRKKQEEKAAEKKRRTEDGQQPGANAPVAPSNGTGHQPSRFAKPPKSQLLHEQHPLPPELTDQTTA